MDTQRSNAEGSAARTDGDAKSSNRSADNHCRFVRPDTCKLITKIYGYVPLIAGGIIIIAGVFKWMEF